MRALIGRPQVRLGVLVVVPAIVGVVAVNRTGTQQLREPRVLTVADPSAGSHLLEALPVPAGFRRVAACRPAPRVPSVCFQRVPSVALDSASWAGIITQLGMPLKSKPECSLPRLFPGHAEAVNCLAFARIGSQQVQLNAVSVVLATLTGFTPTSDSFGSFRGTSISVLDVGD